MDGHSYLRTHNLKSEHMLLDLGEVITEMHGESATGQTRGAVTLVKENGMSVVLTHLHKGAQLNEHAAPGPATVQVLDGHARIQIGDQSVDVPAGRLMAFDAGVQHSVQALEDTTLLLTLTGVSS